MLLQLLATPCHAAEDGGIQAFVPPAVLGDAARVLVSDAGWVPFDAPGAWLPEARAIHVAKQLADLRAENEALRTAPVSTPVAVVVAIGVGVLLGAAGAGYVAWRVGR